MRKPYERWIIMASEYFTFYLLSYFELERLTNIPQILHVFQGKRTPSMFYRIEKNSWHSGFQLSSKIQSEHLENSVRRHLKKGWLEDGEKGYQLTYKGLKAYDNYFSQHYYPEEIQSFTNANSRIPFWERLQLFSQVFSEMSYHNESYVPIIKHPHHQESVRNLFRQLSGDKQPLLERWIEEQAFIFKQLDKRMADVLMNQLTGHKKVGQTKDQIRELLSMEALEFQFYLNDGLEILIQLIKKNRKIIPIHSAILESVFMEHNYGLSASTKQTYDLLKKGYSVNKIANIRKIKENTVKEHILEIAFVFENFPFKAFIPKELNEKLKVKFEHQENYTYKEATSDFEQLEFMHFRLTELERMRKSGKSN